MIVQEPQIPFWSFHLGDLLVLLGVVIAAIAYLSDKRTQSQERTAAREKMAEEQGRMHEENRQNFAENRRRLEELETINRKRDEQISLLTTQTATIATQTATLAEMARGLNRRLEMLEDRG